MMSESLWTALMDYDEKRPIRLHMPGHKGHGHAFPHSLRKAAAFDVTELPGLDDLYAPDGCLKGLEQRLAWFYNAGASLLSPGGSTLCIQTMLTLFCQPGETIIAGRSLHKSAVAAMGLLDLHPVWLYPEAAEGFWLGITSRHLREALSGNPNASAVYITSPDYWGHVTDIEALAAVCRTFGVPLLVDNAHGAHLPLTEHPHPMALGADACADSLHKTLPAFTGTAALHLRDGNLYHNAKEAMGLFGSTSPSYLLMVSGEAALDWLWQKHSLQAAKELAKRLSPLKMILQKKGYSLTPEPCDPWKICFCWGDDARKAVGSILERYEIVPELLSDHRCLLMCSPQNQDAELQALAETIEALPETQGSTYTQPLPPAVKRLSIREGLFRPRERVLLKDAEGAICGAATAPCPPGIAVTAPGEVFTPQALAYLHRMGVQNVSVLCR